MKRSAPLRRTSRRRPPMPALVYDLVMHRADGKCELPHEGACMGRLTWAHRLARHAGGSDVASNGLAVCWFWAHRVESQPSRWAAFEHGWIVSRHDERAPAEIPVLLRVGWVTLTDSGLVLPWEERAAVVAFLRRDSSCPCCGGARIDAYATAIERGDHLRDVNPNDLGDDDDNDRS